MNDPTENMFRLLDYNKYDLYSPDLSTLDRMGILSMAFGTAVEVEESAFMWAHYGNELKGFCLVFDFNIFISDIKDSIEKHGRINYRKFPHLLSGENLINEKSGIENIAGANFQLHNLNRIYDVCFFDKPIDFEHEREYRFLAKGYGLKPYSIDSLLTVIIGEKMSIKDRDILLKTLEKLGIRNKVKVAKVKENSFKVHVTSGESDL
ncbi:DUF2971 domain-containing protein [Aliivibrio fischeri]|uniref:DUF2971 domain-containing protein n=1 Tax=Aliivibrio fischeri TaxID=668 RepID=UPI0018C5057A|nr:DUF2971 domain-containing protein [Aliivibrio fischeri]